MAASRSLPPLLLLAVWSPGELAWSLLVPSSLLLLLLLGAAGLAASATGPASPPWLTPPPAAAAAVAAAAAARWRCFLAFLLGFIGLDAPGGWSAAQPQSRMQRRIHQSTDLQAESTNSPAGAALKGWPCSAACESSAANQFTRLAGAGSVAASGSLPWPRRRAPFGTAQAQAGVAIQMPMPADACQVEQRPGEREQQ
jgi:hypothetical protein